MIRYLSALFCFILIMSLSVVEADAQYRSGRKNVKHRFNAGLIMGLGFSQIDGDLYTGFDKRGIRGGLKGAMYLNDRLDLVVGLLYNQKGSKFEDNAVNLYYRNKKRVIHFDYMEVPLLLSFKMQKNKERGYVLEAGFSYARLINHRIEEVVQDPNQNISFDSITEAFNSNEFNFVCGLNYFFNRHIGVGLAYTIQMNEVYHNTLLDNAEPFTLASAFNNDPTLKIPYLRNYQLALQVVYNVF